MNLYHYADWDIPLKKNSRYPIDKFQKLVNIFSTSSSLKETKLHPARRATTKEIETVHSKEYIHAILNCTLTFQQEREMGFPNSPELGERALRIVGATIQASHSAIKEGLSGVLGGGAHHAYQEAGKGFCIFNDIAIGAKTVLKEYNKKVLIFDCDVHQGDGTAHIFSDVDSIFTVSIHSESNYPFRKQQSDIDVGLPDEVSDHEYREILKDTLEKSLALFEPDFIYFIAGADPFKEDKLGRLHLSKKCLARRDHYVIERATMLKIPICILLSGGYCDPIDLTVNLNYQTYQIAMEVYKNTREVREFEFSSF